MHIHSLVDQKIRQIKLVKTHKVQNGQNGNGQTGNGNGAGNGNGNGVGGNGQNTGETYLAADVRKMPDGGYGVYADKFVKGKRVMTPGMVNIEKNSRRFTKIKRMQMITWPQL